MNNQEYKKPTINLGRFRWIYLIITLVFLYYAAQLFNYQIIEGKTYVGSTTATGLCWRETLLNIT